MNATVSTASSNHVTSSSSNKQELQSRLAELAAERRRLERLQQIETEERILRADIIAVVREIIRALRPLGITIYDLV